MMSLAWHEKNIYSKELGERLLNSKCTLPALSEYCGGESKASLYKVRVVYSVT